MGTLSLIYYDPARVGSLGGIGSLEEHPKGLQENGCPPKTRIVYISLLVDVFQDEE